MTLADNALTLIEMREEFRQIPSAPSSCHAQSQGRDPDDSAGYGCTFSSRYKRS